MKYLSKIDWTSDDFNVVRAFIKTLTRFEIASMQIEPWGFPDGIAIEIQRLCDELKGEDVNNR